MPHKDPVLRAASIKACKTKTINRRKEMLSCYVCLSCGNADPSVIQWHHVDPATKEIELWKTAWAEDKFWNEILKCIPLCANCHVKVHKNELCLLKSPTAYKHQAVTENTCVQVCTCSQ